MKRLVMLTTVLALCMPTYGEILVYKVSGRTEAVVNHQLVRSRVNGYLVVDVDFTTTPDTIDNSALILFGKVGRDRVCHTIYDVFALLVTNAMVAAEVMFQGAEAIVIGKTKATEIGNGDQNVARGLKGYLLLDGYLPLSNDTGYGSGIIRARLDTRRTKSANKAGDDFDDVVDAIESDVCGIFHIPPIDSTPPTPDPMTWASEPNAAGHTQISMTATTATDVNPPVEYYFTNLSVFYHNSGWQSSPVYIDTGLDPNTQYCYKVKAKDGYGNRTADSNQACATTDFLLDPTPPSPDPMTWATEPNAQGLDDSISMTATDACDVSGVQYYFTNLTELGHDSGWQDGKAYTDTGLDPNTQYCYTVSARDKSPQLSQTADSNQACATTASLDVNAPTPDPMTFATAPAAASDSEIAMIATTATDVHPVLYYFTCVTDANFNSSWQADTYYIATGLTPATLYSFNVRAKDSIGNTTAPSPNEPATTLFDPPQPDPMTWAIPPYATGPTSIKMKATPATGAPPVQYQFWYTAGPDIGTQARTWNADPNFEDTGLNENSTYGYKTRAKDAFGNTTDWSTAQSAQTTSSP